MKQLLVNPRTVRKAGKAEARLREQMQRKQAQRQIVQREQLAAVLGGESGADQRGFAAKGDGR